MTWATISEYVSRSVIGRRIWARTAAEITAAVAPSDFAYPSDQALEQSRRYGFNWSDRRDQHLFELYLSKYGAVFNGATDDGPAISQALDALNALGKQRRVRMPSGGLTAKINSGFTLHCGGVGVDFNGLTIDATGIAAGNVITIAGAGSAPFSRYAAMLPFENFTLLGSVNEADSPTMIYVQGDAVNGEVTNSALRNFVVYGGKVGLYLGDYVYIFPLFDGVVQNQKQYGVQVHCSVTAGENLNWHGGSISNVQRSDNSGTSVYLENVGGNKALGLHGVSIDYSDLAINIQRGILSCFGCHVEVNNTANPVANITLNAGQAATGLNFQGGMIAITDATKARASIFNVNGGFVTAATKLYTYDYPAVIANTSNGAQIDLAGSTIEYNGATQANVPVLGSALSQLANGDFEAGNLNGWTLTGTGGGNYTWTADNAVKHLGNWSAKAVAINASNGSIYEVIPCRPGRKLYVDFWTNVSAFTAGSVTPTVFFYQDAALTELVGSQTVHTYNAVTGGWDRQTGRYTVPAGANFARVGVNGNAFTGTFNVDDITAAVQ